MLKEGSFYPHEWLNPLVQTGLMYTDTRRMLQKRHITAIIAEEGGDGKRT